MFYYLIPLFSKFWKVYTIYHKIHHVKNSTRNYINISRNIRPFCLIRWNVLVSLLMWWTWILHFIYCFFPLRFVQHFWTCSVSSFDELGSFTSHVCSITFGWPSMEFLQQVGDLHLKIFVIAVQHVEIHLGDLRW